MKWFRVYSFCSLFFLTQMLHANEPFGPIEEAKKRVPHCFVSDAVGEMISDSGKTVYYYNGTAEQVFTGKFAEAENELWQEAALDAKTKLHHFFQQNYHSVITLEIKGASCAYAWREGAQYRVLYVVEKSSVSLKHASATSVPQKIATPSIDRSPKNDRPHPSQKKERESGISRQIKMRNPAIRLTDVEPSEFQPVQFKESDGELSPFKPPLLIRSNQ